MSRFHRNRGRRRPKKWQRRDSTAKIALGVPENFDPLTSWLIPIIGATVDASSIEPLGAYRQAALDAGWVVMAADPPVKPKEDSPRLPRGALARLEDVADCRPRVLRRRETLRVRRRRAL